MDKEDIVSSNPEVVSGALVFAGTRVPVRALVDYLAGGHPLDEFLDGFPSVSREQAVGYLEMTLEEAEHSAGARAFR